MPFHIKHTGPAAVSMFLRVEKMRADDEEVKREENETMEAVVPEVEMKSDSSEPAPVNPVQLVQRPTTEAKDRCISSFRGRTIHGLTVDVPTGYTGLVLQGDPQQTRRVLNAEVKSGLEGEDERDEDSGIKEGRNTRSKVKGKEKEKVKTKGRLARTAAPKRPEMITVDNEDEEMADPAPTELTAEVLDHPSESILNDSVENDLGVDEEIPLHKLVPQSTFSSITLWHADRAVDETRDEYYKTLTEWMTISHEVNNTMQWLSGNCGLTKRNTIDSSNRLVNQAWHKTFVNIDAN